MTKWIIALGMILVLIGAMLHFAPWTLNWFGKLPGDIRIETDKIKLYIPVTSMLIISVVITLTIHFMKR